MEKQVNVDHKRFKPHTSDKNFLLKTAYGTELKVCLNTLVFASVTTAFFRQLYQF